MKLFFLNTNIGYGGASKMIVWVANQCALAGHDVTFLTYRDSEVRQPLDSRVKHVHEHLENVGGNVSLLLSVKWLHKFIKSNHFDVGVAFLSPSILRMALAAKGTRMKVLFSHRADPYLKLSTSSLKAKVINWLNNWAFEQANFYVFQTKMAQAYYDEGIKNRSTVIPNPIRPMQRTESRDGNIRKSFVAVGRLELKQKRQDVMIDAFNILSQKYSDFKLEIYGDGEDEEKVKQLAASNPNIRLMGKTNNVASVIQHACATVLSSDYEGIPNALLESMSLGVPSISTDCSPGGAAMLIRNKENGMLIPRGDAVALAEAMEYVITHSEEAEKMGAHAMEVNSLYAENVIADKWKKVFNRLMQ